MTISKTFQLKPFEANARSSKFECSGELRSLTPATLQVLYDLAGPIDSLQISKSKGAPEQKLNLWRKTCFELFVSEKNATSYREFNFSPSKDFGYYEFENYRAEPDCPELDESFCPTIEVMQDPAGKSLLMKVSIPAQALPSSDFSTLEFGVAAVLQEIDGSYTFWALEHGSRKPDFHLRSTFKQFF